VILDLEEEAVNMIQRAITNYEKLRPGLNRAFQEFQSEASAWFRRKQPLIPLTQSRVIRSSQKAGVIAKDQSTKILESRKLEKNELDILEKVIDVVYRSKK